MKSRVGVPRRSPGTTPLRKDERASTKKLQKRRSLWRSQVRCVLKAKVLIHRADDWHFHVIFMLQVAIGTHAPTQQSSTSYTRQVQSTRPKVPLAKPSHRKDASRPSNADQHITCSEPQIQTLCNQRPSMSAQNPDARSVRRLQIAAQRGSASAGQ